MKKYKILIAAFMLAAKTYSAKAVDIYFFLTNSESTIVEFINSNPTNDYTEFRVDGTHSGSRLSVVEFAAHKNYTNLLDTLEGFGAISEFVVSSNMPTPLAMAVRLSSTQAVEYLANIRPDWLDVESPLVGPPLFESLRSNMLSIAEILLDAGANVHATNYMGMTPLDIVAIRDVNLFELIRSRGGLFNRHVLSGPNIHPTVRSALIEKYASQTCEAYSNYFAFPSGQTLYYPVAENLLHGIMYTGELSSAQSDLLNSEMLSVASNCYGTVVIRYHYESHHGVFGYIYPVLEAHQIYGIMIKGDDVDRAWFNENVFPTLNP